MELVTTTDPQLKLMEITNSSSRSSKLSASTIALTGHEGVIHSISFSPSGNNLASASMDGKIFLWETFGENKNYNVLTGHKNAVLELKWLSEINIVSCSADKTLSSWDANKGQRTRKFEEHSAIVNCCAVAKLDAYLFVSGADDGQVLAWDIRTKSSIANIDAEYPVLCTCLSADGSAVYFGGIDNTIHRWDLRLGEADPTFAINFEGHRDSVTGISLSPDGNHLLSNSMDGHLYSWDTRPFVIDPNNRCEREYEGVQHNNERNLLRCSWSADQEFVACGSADRIVKVWNSTTSKLIYYLPGHKGSVNDVIFHPTEPIVASCGSDKTVLLGELE